MSDKEEDLTGQRLFDTIKTTIVALLIPWCIWVSAMVISIKEDVSRLEERLAGKVETLDTRISALEREAEREHNMRYRPTATDGIP